MGGNINMLVIHTLAVTCHGKLNNNTAGGTVKSCTDSAKMLNKKQL